MQVNFNFIKQACLLLPGNVYYKNTEGEYLWCNNDQLKLMGATKLDEVVGKRDIELYSESIADMYSRNDNAMMSNGVEMTSIEEVKNADGQVIKLVTKRTPVYENKNKLIGLLGVSFELSKSEELGRSQAFILDYIIGKMPEHIYWKDKQGRFLGCNEKQAKSAGLNDRSEIIGKTDYDMPWKDQAGDLKRVDDFVMKSGEAVQVEEKSLLPDGTLATFLSNKVPLLNVRGNTIGVLGISVDITTKKEAEEKIKLAKNISEKADKIKSIFMRTFNKEIRIPIQNVVGLSQILEKSDLDSTQREMVELIFQSGVNVVPMLDRINAYLELENENYKPAYDDVELNGLLQETLKRYAPVIQEKNLSTEFQYDKKIPYYLKTDVIILRDIFENLIENVTKYSIAGGKIKITVDKGKILDDKTIAINMTFSDSGPGIAKGSRRYIFSMFDYSDEANIHIEAGLKLSLVKKMVDILEGAITLSSQPGKGTTFRLTIPFLLSETKKNQNFEDIERLMEETRRAMAEKPVKILPLSVLIVEDDRINRRILKIMIEQAYDFKIDAVATAEEAFSLLKKGSYDLVFIDIELPDYSGTELYKKALKVNLSKMPAFIAVTGHALEAQREHYTDLGIMAVIPKPYTYDELLETIKDVISELNEDEDED